MKKLYIEKREDTPLVNFDPSSGNCRIEGMGYPENSSIFLNPIYEWLDEYVQSPNSETIVEVEMLTITLHSLKDCLKF